MTKHDPYAHADGSRECRPAEGPHSHKAKREAKLKAEHDRELTDDEVKRVARALQLVPLSSINATLTNESALIAACLAIKAMKP